MDESEITSELLVRAAGLDVMLPGQFDDLFRSTERTPEQRLMLAVLEDAIHCWFGAPPALLGGAYTGSKRMRLAREAERWLFGDENCAPISFHTCCGALGIGGEWLREKLRRIAGAAEHGRRRKRARSPVRGEVRDQVVRNERKHKSSLSQFALLSHHSCAREAAEQHVRHRG
jgi:hypothetical protein